MGDAANVTPVAVGQTIFPNRIGVSIDNILVLGIEQEESLDLVLHSLDYNVAIQAMSQFIPNADIDTSGLCLQVANIGVRPHAYGKIFTQG